MAVRFLCDANLGKLSKWLRILGYDTLCERSAADLSLVRRARREGRIALTRKRGLAGDCGRIVMVMADRVDEQLGEVMDALLIKPDPKERMTLCLRCNVKLRETAKADVAERVPAYVYQSCTAFRICPVCGRVYWRGTHPRHIAEYLRRVLQNPRMGQAVQTGPGARRAKIQERVHENTLSDEV
jgi:uncharacterized protein